MNRPGFTLRSTSVAVFAAGAAALAVAGCGTSNASSPAAASGSASGHASAKAAAGSPAASSASGTVSSPAFFPIAVGNTWVYQEKLSSGQGTVTNQVTSVTPASSGSQVVMKIRENLPGLAHLTTRSTFVVHPDGSISVPLTQLGSTAVSVQPGSIVWPSAAQLASGQPYTDNLVITVHEAGRAMTVRPRVVVQGAGTQSVTVPAGTYQATLISEKMDEAVMGVTVRLDIQTWVANGVGPVKSEVISRTAGVATIASEQVLKSFTKG